MKVNLCSCWHDLNVDAYVEVTIQCCVFDLKCSDSNNLWFYDGSIWTNYCDKDDIEVSIVEDARSVAHTLYLDYSRGSGDQGDMGCM